MKICSPQLEKGHTRIANELLEAIIAYPFTMAQLKMLLVVIRKTYGWRKKKAQISYGTISYLTGLNKRYVKKVVEQLVKDKVLFKQKKQLQEHSRLKQKIFALEPVDNFKNRCLPGHLKGVFQNTG